MILLRKLVTALLIFLMGYQLGIIHEKNDKTIFINDERSNLQIQAPQPTYPAPEPLVQNGTPTQSQRVAKLERIFTHYHSPLASQAAMLVAVSSRDDIDYRLLPAIAFTESTLCRSYISSTNNCFGFGSGQIRFGSYEEAESYISTFLSKSAYYRQFRVDESISTLAKTYNAADTQKWTQTVEGFMSEIN